MHGWQVDGATSEAGIGSGNNAWQAAQAKLAQIDAERRRN